MMTVGALKFAAALLANPITWVVLGIMAFLELGTSAAIAIFASTLVSRYNPILFCVAGACLALLGNGLATLGVSSIVALLAPVTRRFAASPIVHLAPSHVVRASRVLLSSLVHPAPGTITPDVHLDRVLLTLACEILRECTDAGDLCDEDGSMEARLRALLHERHTDPELDVAQLARELHVSRRQLYRHARLQHVLAERDDLPAVVMRRAADLGRREDRLALAQSFQVIN